MHIYPTIFNSNSQIIIQILDKFNYLKIGHETILDESVTYNIKL